MRNEPLDRRPGWLRRRGGNGNGNVASDDVRKKVGVDACDCWLRCVRVRQSSGVNVLTGGYRPSDIAYNRLNGISLSPLLLRPYGSS